jgi:DNA-binding transcriptional LysR family regulator
VLDNKNEIIESGLMEKHTEIKRPVLNMRQLYYFNAIAAEGSISRAAERLHLSQPPLTTQIKLLEAELGVVLLKRHKRGVTLTSAGHALAEEARSILIRAEQSVDRIRQVGRGEVGALRLGIIGSIMWGDFAFLLQRYKDAYPAVTWSLHELSPNEQITALQDRRIDVGFWRTDSYKGDDLQRLKLSNESIVAAFPESHPLTKKRKIELKDFASEPLILMNPEDSDFAANMIKFCRQAGFEPKVIHKAKAPATLLALVSSGAGITFLAESLQNVKWPGVVFKKVVSPKISADLYMYSRVGDTSALISNFAKLALKAPVKQLN